MKKTLLMLFVIIAAPNCIKAQFKFSLTPDKITTGKSELISNCVGYSEYFDFDQNRPEYVTYNNRNFERRSWSLRENRKYNIDYKYNYENFNIEEIGTGRKIVFIKPNGEIINKHDCSESSLKELRISKIDNLLNNE